MKHPDDDEFSRALRDQLRASENLDAVTRARLAAARARALDARPASAWTGARLWVGGGSAVAAALLVALVLVRTDRSTTAHEAMAQADALELMFDEEALPDPEFYEDVDVLTWLAEGDDRA